MPFAYFILAHKNPRQIARLVSALDGPGNLFLVIYDKKSPASEHKQLLTLLQQRRDVLVLDRQPIYWAGMSIFKAELSAMREALEHSNDLTHFINLGGQDFPLVTQNQLASDFIQNPRCCLLSYFDALDSNIWPDGLNRLNSPATPTTAIHEICHLHSI